jgi:hypothetical protein
MTSPPATLVAVVLTALVLTGCLGRDQAGPEASRPPQNILQATQARAARAGTAHYTLAEGLAGGVDLRGRGRLDYRTDRFSLALAYGTGKRAFTSDWLNTPDSIYFRNQVTLPKGHWWRSSKKETGVVGAMTDPMAQLLQLSELGDRAEKVGPATVHGVPTTKYTGELRYDKKAGWRSSKAVDEMYEALETGQMFGVTAVPFELYLDDAGLPVRVVVTIGKDPKELVTSTRRTLDYRDWGAPVDIPLPPPSQTSDHRFADPVPTEVTASP